MSNNKKISILGSGRVGSSIAYSLILDGICSEIVLVDIAKDLARGESMDMIQGTPFSNPVNIYAGEYEDVRDSDIVIVTLGKARQAGQSRIELVQNNVDIIKNVMPQIVSYAPDAIYIVVSNPVDVLTYAIQKITGLPKERVIGTGTLLDSSRLRTILAQRAQINPGNVHGYVLGEHGDSSFVPWSLASIAGMELETYDEQKFLNEYDKIQEEVRGCGADVIKNKGATNYAIAMSVRHLVDSIIRNTRSVLTVSSLMEGEYGLENVCLSIPTIVGGEGIIHTLEPKLEEQELAQLKKSAHVLKDVIDTIQI